MAQPSYKYKHKSGNKNRFGVYRFTFFGSGGYECCSKAAAWRTDQGQGCLDSMHPNPRSQGYLLQHSIQVLKNQEELIHVYHGKANHDSKNWVGSIPRHEGFARRQVLRAHEKICCRLVYELPNNVIFHNRRRRFSFWVTAFFILDDGVFGLHPKSPPSSFHCLTAFLF